MNSRPFAARILENEYRDSGTLMRVSRALETKAGVRRAAAVMATPRNLETLNRLGLAPPVITAPVKPSDLIVVVEGEHGADIAAVFEDLTALLAPPKPAAAGALLPATLDDALEAQPESRLAVVSVPGPFAAYEASKALDAGLDVMIFSNGVSLEDERWLKEKARARGQMVMGPDCGTAILDGVALGFANALRPGAIGVVAASGTGLQELTCQIDQLGAGISHAVGTGGRDLRADVGALTTLTALDRLETDPGTRVLVLISKPPSVEVATQVLDRATSTGRPVVACFLGPHTLAARGGVTLTESIEEAARIAAAHAGHLTPRGPAALPAETRKFGPEQRLLRGLFTGGTLAFEALTLLTDRFDLHSNLSFEKVAPTLSFRAAGHSILDMGEDEFTRGRPHPMIDPTLRHTAIRVAAEDPRVRVLLVDVVLGYGAHPDPAGELAPVIEDYRREVERRGDAVTVVASVTGTNADPQNRARQVERLRAVGVEVMNSNAAAVRRAAEYLAMEETP
ncbi:MAG: acyl-CoA synthetase FdrA [Myxococcales bacterium]|nr:acyl-CoA synthetase FdrA [Myxococcales bacterium]